MSEDVSVVNNASDITADTVYSNLANLLTALQSAHPAGHTLDTCLVSRLELVDSVQYHDLLAISSTVAMESLYIKYCLLLVF